MPFEHNKIQHEAAVSQVEKTPKELFYSMLSHVDGTVTKVVDIFHLLDTLQKMSKAETDSTKLAELEDKIRMLESQAHEQLNGLFENGMYGRLADLLKDAYQDFIPEELYGRKPKENFLTSFRDKIVSWFSKKEKNEGKYIPSINNYLGTDKENKNLVAQIKIDLDVIVLNLESGVYADTDLEKIINFMADLEMILDHLVKVNHISGISDIFLTTFDAVKRQYLEKKGKKRSEYFLQHNRLSFATLKKIYEKIGFFDQNKHDRQGNNSIHLFLKGYFLMFSQLQSMYAMQWNDAGSIFSRKSLIQPRDIIADFQILLDAYESEHAMIDNFWPREVGRHILTWELTFSLAQQKGKQFTVNFDESVSNPAYPTEELTFQLLAHDWKSQSSGLVKLSQDNSFSAVAYHQGKRIGDCTISVDSATSQAEKSKFIELDGTMDVIHASQNESDTDLALRQWGAYPSEFLLTPEYTAKIAEVDESILYSNLIQKKLLTLRRGRNDKPHVLSPLQRKKTYTVLMYYGEKYKKIAIPDEVLTSSPEEFHAFLGQQQNLDYSGQFDSFTNLDLTEKKWKKTLKKSYSSSDRIHEVQDEIADLDNTTAADLCLVIANENDFGGDARVGDNLGLGFEYMFSDVRTLTNGVRKLETIVLKKGLHGQVESVATMTNHSSGDGVAQVEETKSVFKDAVDSALISTTETLTRFPTPSEFVPEKKLVLSGVATPALRSELRKEYIDEFEFPSQTIRSMIDDIVPGTDMTLYEFWKEKYGIKLSLTNLFPFVDMMIAGTDHWTFLVKKVQNDRLIPAVTLFPDSLKNIVRASTLVEDIAIEDAEALALQFLHFEMDKQAILNNEGMVATAAMISKGVIRDAARVFGNQSDRPLTDLVQNTGMHSTTIKGKGFQYTQDENGKKTYSFRKGEALQQKRFATARSGFSPKGEMASCEYLKNVGTPDNPNYQPYVYVSFRKEKQHGQSYDRLQNIYFNHLYSLVHFFQLAAEKMVKNENK